MRLQRLEMPHLPKEYFSAVFRNLCDVSRVIRHLRSLSISLPSNETRCFRALSIAFPDLTHLTLHITERITNSYSDNSSSTLDEEGDEKACTLVHRKLEVLFLFSEQFIRLDHWRLPQIQHVHLRPAGLFWKDDVYPFLQRHGDTIITLDLDDTTSGIILTRSQNINTDIRSFPAGFWDTFPQLQLLRCALWLVEFEDFPPAGHPLSYLVDTDAIESAKRLVRILKPWVDGRGQANLQSIAVYGPFLSKDHHRWEGGELRRLLHLMRWNGTRLVNPAGRQWIESI